MSSEFVVLIFKTPNYELRTHNFNIPIILRAVGGVDLYIIDGEIGSEY